MDSNTNRSYRIRTKVGDNDGVVNVDIPLVQTYDTFEILSLKLNQKNQYNYYDSSYGVIVGRALANGNFGIPNAKISIFIPVDDNADLKERILYNFASVRDTNFDKVRYNLLPDFVDVACHQDVGTFPNKRLVLDNKDVIEIFDKYYKYTTTTNQSGDYMLFGVPTGSQNLHVDIDLSDIGVLSQRPRDMIYKGYDINQFDSPNKFKNDTNLNSLSQIYSQDKGIYCYPYWGNSNNDNDSGRGHIAITRCDIQIDYKFEPTAIFMGSIITDKGANAIGKNCTGTDTLGKMSDLTTGEGIIEMIRKTVDDKVEQFQIKGDRLIDGDGVWCYQIPMNLDYVMTDEFGNMVPTDDPSKGIPTRTRARFRISLVEMDEDVDANKRCRFLVPNNPRNNEEDFPEFYKTKETDYEFGSSTRDESYCDMFWNNVYTVKSYIPRLQKNRNTTNKKHTGIKLINHYGDNNPMPYNGLNIKLSFAFRFICLLIKILIYVIASINQIVGLISEPFCYLSKALLGIAKGLSYIPFGIGDVLGYPFKLLGNVFEKLVITGIVLDSEMCDDGINKIAFYPVLAKFLVACTTSKIRKEWGDKYRGSTNLEEIEELRVIDITSLSNNEFVTCVEQQLAEDNDATSFLFQNDWINGILYAPLWYRYIRKKKKYFFGLFKKKAKDQWCRSDGMYNLIVYQPCALSKNLGNTYQSPNNKMENAPASIKSNCGTKCHNEVAYQSVNGGLILTKDTMLGETVYYYKAIEYNYNLAAEKNNDGVILLFATDIVLLGSLNDCDSNGIPQLIRRLKSTTFNMPTSILFVDTQIATNPDGTAVIMEDGRIPMSRLTEATGADWGNLNSEDECGKMGKDSDSGLFYGIGCSTIELERKSCLNLSRVCELGVTLDASQEIANVNGGDLEYLTLTPDGFISYDEIYDSDARSMFATLNNNNLKTKIDEKTGYKKYDFFHFYVNNFDGLSSSLMRRSGRDCNYTSNYNLETFCRDYYIFRMGYNPFYYDNENRLPRYENSFYFYFGLKNGKTAIDKFNGQFYATCEDMNNVMSPIKVDYKPNDWCDNSRGYIKLDLSKCSLPCDMLINYEGMTAFENGINNETVMLTNSVTDEKYQRIIPKIVNTDSDFELENKEYEFTITDADGQIITFTVDLAANKLSFLYQTINNEIDNNIRKSEYNTYNELYGDVKKYINTVDDLGGYIVIDSINNGADTNGKYKVEVQCYSDNALDDFNEALKDEFIKDDKNGQYVFTELDDTYTYPTYKESKNGVYVFTTEYHGDGDETLYVKKEDGKGNHVYIPMSDEDDENVATYYIYEYSSQIYFDDENGNYKIERKTNANENQTLYKKDENGFYVEDKENGTFVISELNDEDIKLENSKENFRELNENQKQYSYPHYVEVVPNKNYSGVLYEKVDDEYVEVDNPYVLTYDDSEAEYIKNNGEYEAIRNNPDDIYVRNTNGKYWLNDGEYQLVNDYMPSGTVTYNRKDTYYMISPLYEQVAYEGKRYKYIEETEEFIEDEKGDFYKIKNVFDKCSPQTMYEQIAYTGKRYKYIEETEEFIEDSEGTYVLVDTTKKYKREGENYVADNEGNYFKVGEQYELTTKFNGSVKYSIIQPNGFCYVEYGSRGFTEINKCTPELYKHIFEIKNRKLCIIVPKGGINYEVAITQICGDCNCDDIELECLSDNRTSNIIRIADSIEYRLFVNDVDVASLNLSKFNSGWSLSSQSGYTAISPKFSNVGSGWFNLNDDSNYVWENTDEYREATETISDLFEQFNRLCDVYENTNIINYVKNEDGSYYLGKWDYEDLKQTADGQGPYFLEYDTYIEDEYGKRFTKVDNLCIMDLKGCFKIVEKDDKYDGIAYQKINETTYSEFAEGKYGMIEIPKYYKNEENEFERVDTYGKMVGADGYVKDINGKYILIRIKNDEDYDGTRYTKQTNESYIMDENGEYKVIEDVTLYRKVDENYLYEKILTPDDESPELRDVISQIFHIFNKSIDVFEYEYTKSDDGVYRKDETYSLIADDEDYKGPRYKLNNDGSYSEIANNETYNGDEYKKEIIYIEIVEESYKGERYSRSYVNSIPTLISETNKINYVGNDANLLVEEAKENFKEKVKNAFWLQCTNGTKDIIVSVTSNKKPIDYYLLYNEEEQNTESSKMSYVLTDADGKYAVTDEGKIDTSIYYVNDVSIPTITDRTDADYGDNNKNDKTYGDDKRCFGYVATTSGKHVYKKPYAIRVENSLKKKLPVNGNGKIGNNNFFMFHIIDKRLRFNMIAWSYIDGLPYPPTGNNNGLIGEYIIKKGLLCGDVYNGIPEGINKNNSIKFSNVELDDKPLTVFNYKGATENDLPTKRRLFSEYGYDEYKGYDKPEVVGDTGTLDSYVALSNKQTDMSIEASNCTTYETIYGNMKVSMQDNDSKTIYLKLENGDNDVTYYVLDSKYYPDFSKNNDKWNVSDINNSIMRYNAEDLASYVFSGKMSTDKYGTNTTFTFKDDKDKRYFVVAETSNGCRALSPLYDFKKEIKFGLCLIERESVEIKEVENEEIGETTEEYENEYTHTMLVVIKTNSQYYLANYPYNVSIYLKSNNTYFGGGINTNEVAITDEKVIKYLNKKKKRQLNNTFKVEIQDCTNLKLPTKLDKIFGKISQYLITWEDIDEVFDIEDDDSSYGIIQIKKFKFNETTKKYEIVDGGTKVLTEDTIIYLNKNDIVDNNNLLAKDGSGQLIAEPIKWGEEFVGWRYQGVGDSGILQSTTRANKSLIITAEFKPVQITFKPEGGMWGDGSTTAKTITVDGGFKASAPSIPSLNTTTKKWIFDKWGFTSLPSGTSAYIDNNNIDVYSCKSSTVTAYYKKFEIPSTSYTLRGTTRSVTISNIYSSKNKDADVLNFITVDVSGDLNISKTNNGNNFTLVIELPSTLASTDSRKVRLVQNETGSMFEITINYSLT